MATRNAETKDSVAHVSVEQKNEKDESNKELERENETNAEMCLQSCVCLQASQNITTLDFRVVTRVIKCNYNTHRK